MSTIVTDDLQFETGLPGEDWAASGEAQSALAYISAWVFVVGAWELLRPCARCALDYLDQVLFAAPGEANKFQRLLDEIPPPKADRPVPVVAAPTEAEAAPAPKWCTLDASGDRLPSRRCIEFVDAGYAAPVLTDGSCLDEEFGSGYLESREKARGLFESGSSARFTEKLRALEAQVDGLPVRCYVPLESLTAHLLEGVTLPEYVPGRECMVEVWCRDPFGQPARRLLRGNDAMITFPMAPHSAAAETAVARAILTFYGFEEEVLSREPEGGGPQTAEAATEAEPEAAAQATATESEQNEEEEEEEDDDEEDEEEESDEEEDDDDEEEEEEEGGSRDPFDDGEGALIFCEDNTEYSVDATATVAPWVRDRAEDKAPLLPFIVRDTIVADQAVFEFFQTYEVWALRLALTFKDGSSSTVLLDECGYKEERDGW
jgi:hypothetical protein